MQKLIDDRYAYLVKRHPTITKNKVKRMTTEGVYLVITSNDHTKPVLGNIYVQIEVTDKRPNRELLERKYSPGAYTVISRHNFL